MRNPALFSRIFNTPLMIHPSKLDAIIGGIGQRFGIETPIDEKTMAMVATAKRGKEGYQLMNGIAVIDVFGVLAHRGGFQADSSYILGYQELSRQIHSAVNDEDVSGLLLVMDSPGGEVAGCFELATQIRQWTEIKPIWSVVSSLSASASYMLSAATLRTGISATGVAGSIGVVMRHVDVSKMAEKDGVKVTHIFAGARKVDGNQFQPLTKEVEQRYQAETNTLYELFTNTVADYRRMSVNDVRTQEAAVYTGQDAITAGLVDVITTPDEMLAEMQQHILQSNGSFQMSEPSKKPSDNAPTQDTVQASFDDGNKKGVAAGATAERTRIKAILSHEAATGREKQAMAMALETDLQPEAVAKVLELSPVVTVTTLESSPDQFSQHMDALGNPSVGLGAEENNKTDAQKADSVAMEGWTTAAKTLGAK